MTIVGNNDADANAGPEGEDSRCRVTKSEGRKMGKVVELGEDFELVERVPVEMETNFKSSLEIGDEPQTVQEQFPSHPEASQTR